MTESEDLATIQWIVDRTGGLFLLSQLLAHIKIQAFLKRGLGEQEALLLNHFTIDLSHPGHGDLMLSGNLRKGQDTSQSVLLDAQNQIGHSTHNFPFKLFGSDFKIEPSIVDVSAEEARQSILLGNGLHGLVPVGFAFFHHGWIMAEDGGIGKCKL
jgi:hypothetical protein